MATEGKRDPALGDFGATVEALKWAQAKRAPELTVVDPKKRGRDALGILKRWGVPTRPVKTLAAVGETPTLKAVAEWHKGADWCLVLSAGVGTGKTTAAAWWLWQLAHDLEVRGSPIPRWWTASRFRRISDFDASRDLTSVTLGQVERLPALVLDDVGAEHSDGGGWMLSKLDSLVDERYSSERRTIITTNLNWDAFAERVGPRIADRLQEGGVFASFSGESMRG